MLFRHSRQRGDAERTFARTYDWSKSNLVKVVLQSAESKGSRTSGGVSLATRDSGIYGAYLGI